MRLSATSILLTRNENVDSVQISWEAHHQKLHDDIPSLQIHLLGPGRARLHQSRQEHQCQSRAVYLAQDRGRARHGQKVCHIMPCVCCALIMLGRGPDAYISHRTGLPGSPFSRKTQPARACESRPPYAYIPACKFRIVSGTNNVERSL